MFIRYKILLLDHRYLLQSCIIFIVVIIYYILLQRGMQISLDLVYGWRIVSKFKKNIHSTSTIVFTFKENIHSTSTFVFTFKKNIYSTSTIVFTFKKNIDSRSQPSRSNLLAGYRSNSTWRKPEAIKMIEAKHWLHRLIV